MEGITTTDTEFNISVSTNSPTAFDENQTSVYNVTTEDVFSSLNATTDRKPLPWLATTSNIIVPTLLLTGVIGNSLTVFVFRSRAFRTTSYSIYLIALATSDTMVLFTLAVNTLFARELFGRDIRALSDAGCKIFLLCTRASKVCSSWIVALISVERFIAVWFPLKTKFIATKRAAISNVCCIVLISFVFFGISAMNHGIVKGTCIPEAGTESKQLAAILSVIAVVIYSVIPPIILLFLTPLIIIQILRQQTLRRKMINSTRGQGQDKEESGTNRVTIMLCTIIIAYIILVTPFPIAYYALFFSGHHAHTTKALWFIVFFEIGQICAQLNYSITFFFYAAYSPAFRQHLCFVFKRSISSSSSEIGVRATASSDIPVVNSGEISVKKALDNISDNSLTLSTTNSKTNTSLNS